MNINDICQRFGQILNGKSEMKHGVCTVEIARDLHVTIQGRPSRAEINAEITFESMDYEGNALNLGETVILEKELTPFVNILVQNGIIISAIHNHWIYTKPNILFVHFQSVEPPLTFARKVAEALRILHLNHH